MGPVGLVCAQRGRRGGFTGQRLGVGERGVASLADRGRGRPLEQAAARRWRRGGQGTAAGLVEDDATGSGAGLIGEGFGHVAAESHATESADKPPDSTTRDNRVIARRSRVDGERV